MVWSLSNLIVIIQIMVEFQSFLGHVCSSFFSNFVVTYFDKDYIFCNKIQSNRHIYNQILPQYIIKFTTKLEYSYLIYGWIWLKLLNSWLNMIRTIVIVIGFHRDFWIVNKNQFHPLKWCKITLKVVNSFFKNWGHLVE